MLGSKFVNYHIKETKLISSVYMILLRGAAFKEAEFQTKHFCCNTQQLSKILYFGTLDQD